MAGQCERCDERRDEWVMAKYLESACYARLARMQICTEAERQSDRAAERRRDREGGTVCVCVCARARALARALVGALLDRTHACICLHPTEVTLPGLLKATSDRPEWSPVSMKMMQGGGSGIV